ncbi:hypothetical protein ABPG72_001431 [Tetrahymena utriculariae]
MSSAKKINYSLIISSQVFSSLYNIILNQQNRAYVNGDLFYHPYCQILLVSISQCLCYFLFSIYKSQYRIKYEEDIKEEKGKRLSTNFKIYIFAIPSFLNFVTQVFQIFTFYSLSKGWSYQLQNGFLIMMALSSIFLLKRKLHRQHFLGLSLIYFGLFFIGLMLSIDYSQSTQVVYYFLYVFSWFSYAAQLSCEEKLYSKYQLNPAQVAAYEGIFGIIFASLGVLISGFIYCDNYQPCYDQQDNFGQFMKQVFSFSNANVFFLVIGGVLFSTFSICTGQAVIKQMSGLTRAILDRTSLFFSWILFVILRQENFQWYILFGYSFCIFGAIIFCEIIVFTCFGMNKKRGHDLVAPSAVAYGQQYYYSDFPTYQPNYPQKNESNFKNEQQNNYNSAGSNKQINSKISNQDDQLSYQPLLANLILESDYKQSGPSNVQNQNNQNQNKDQFLNQNLCFQSSHQNQQEKGLQFLQLQAGQNDPKQPIQQIQNQIQMKNNQNAPKQPNQQFENQNQLNFKTIKEILNEIKQMKFENLAQIKQTIALIDEINAKILQQEYSLKSKIGKILQNIAISLMKNYQNTIKMKLIKLIFEDQYLNVAKINEMRYIQDRLYFLVNNNNINSSCINEVIRWIENNLQPNELAQATQNIQAINQQFLNEQYRNQQTNSNWAEQFNAFQKKIKSEQK